jgi:hypothetical protein
MKYESEFRIKEKEFRPRKDFKHQQVVDELANIVKRADLEIEELEKANYNGSCVLDKLDQKVIYANAEIRTYQYLCCILCLCVVVLGIAALS